MLLKDISGDRTVKDNSEIEETEGGMANNKKHRRPIGDTSPCVHISISTRSVCKQRGSSDEMFKGF